MLHVSQCKMVIPNATHFKAMLIQTVNIKSEQIKVKLPLTRSGKILIYKTCFIDEHVDL